MTRPLPEHVARIARAYLGALVPPAEVSDAWHELVADATYWGDRDLVPVMVMAHQVVLQHQRVAPEVAVLALRDLDMDQPATVAQVLAVDEGTAHRLTDEVAASVEGGPAADAVGRFATGVQDRARTTAPTGSPVIHPADEPGPSRTPSPPAPSTTTDGSGGAVRIGFEDDSPMTGFDEAGSPGGITARRVVLLVAAAVVIVSLWLLLAL